MKKMKVYFILLIILLVSVPSFCYASNTVESTYTQDLIYSFRNTQDYCQNLLIHFTNEGLFDNSDIRYYINSQYVPYVSYFNLSMHRMTVNFYTPIDVNFSYNDEYSATVQYGDWGDTPAFGVPLVARFYVDYLTGEVINYTGDVSQVTIIVPADFIDYYNTTYTNFVVFGYSNKEFLSDVIQSQTIAFV